MTNLEVYVAVKKAQKEARDRILKEAGINRQKWSEVKIQALVEMGQDRERDVNGMRVQIIDTPHYLDKKPPNPLYVEQSLIVSEAR